MDPIFTQEAASQRYDYLSSLPLAKLKQEQEKEKAAGSYTPATQGLYESLASDKVDKLTSQWSALPSKQIAHEFERGLADGEYDEGLSPVAQEIFSKKFKEERSKSGLEKTGDFLASAASMVGNELAAPFTDRDSQIVKPFVKGVAKSVRDLAVGTGFTGADQNQQDLATSRLMSGAEFGTRQTAGLIKDVFDHADDEAYAAKGDEALGDIFASRRVQQRSLVDAARGAGTLVTGDGRSSPAEFDAQDRADVQEMSQGLDATNLVPFGSGFKLGASGISRVLQGVAKKVGIDALEKGAEAITKIAESGPRRQILGTPLMTAEEALIRQAKTDGLLRKARLASGRGTVALGEGIQKIVKALPAENTAGLAAAGFTLAGGGDAQEALTAGLSTIIGRKLLGSRAGIKGLGAGLEMAGKVIQKDLPVPFSKTQNAINAFRYQYRPVKSALTAAGLGAVETGLLSLGADTPEEAGAIVGGGATLGAAGSMLGTLQAVGRDQLVKNAAGVTSGKPEVAVPVPPLGFDAEADKINADTVSQLTPAGSVFLRTARAMLPDQHVYVAATGDQAQAIYSRLTGDQTDVRNVNGVTANAKDGKQLVIIRPAGISPGITGEAGGHEVTHALKAIAKADPKTRGAWLAVEEAARKALGPEGSEVFEGVRDQYESLMPEGTRLTEQQVVDEFIAEHGSVVLSGLPAGKLGGNKGVAQMLSSALFRLAENAGLRKVGVARDGSDPVTSSTLPYTPSFNLLDALEHAINASRLESSDLVPDNSVPVSAPVPATPRSVVSPVPIVETVKPVVPATFDAGPGVLKPIPTGLATDKSLGNKTPPQQPIAPAPEAKAPAGITPEAEKLLASVDGGAAPAFISKNLERIANENGVEVTGKMTPNDVIEAIRAKRSAPAVEPKDFQYTVQRDQDGVSGYVQVDDVTGGTNNESGSVDKFRQRGYDLPDVPESLPQGRYTLDEIKAAAAKEVGEKSVNGALRGQDVQAARTESKSPLTPTEEAQLKAVQPDEAKQSVARKVWEAVKALGGQRIGIPVFEAAINQDGIVRSKRVAPYDIEVSSTGKVTALTVDMDRANYNANLLFDWAKKIKQPSYFGYSGVNDPKFVADMATYLRNQAEGRRGSGEKLTAEGVPPSTGEPAAKLSREQEQFFNILMGQTPPAALTTRSALAIGRIKSTAKASGIDPRVTETGSVEPNALRDALRKEGAPIDRIGEDPDPTRRQSNPKDRNSVIARIRLQDFESATPTGQSVSQPNIRAIEASFMPATVKRAKDFSFTGNYEVEINGKNFRMFRDPSEGSWYDPDKVSGGSTSGFLGFNRAEAIEKLTKIAGSKEASFMPSAAGQPVPAEKGNARQANEDIRSISKEYVKEAGLPYQPHDKAVPVKEETAKAIADLYDKAVDSPNDPEVKKAYTALANETVQQWKAFEKAGYKAELWTGEGQPYADSAAMMKDVRDNKHIYYFGTEGGFGLGGITPEMRSNPMLAESGIDFSNAKNVPVNDVFRVVHDIVGHGAHGYEFGPKGEFNAYLEHSRMFSDAAKPALAAETLAQNSWVNFGPHLRNPDGSLPKKGDANFIPATERRFADQKNIVIPKDILDNVDSYAKESSRPVESETIEGQSVKASEAAENAVSRPAFMPAGKTDSPEFNKWFGKSKAVAPDGSPLKLYHGTMGEFNVFNGGADGGTYFTPHKDVAEFFSTGNDRGREDQIEPRVIEAYVSIKKPKVLNDAQLSLEIGPPGDRDWSGMEGVIEEAKDEGYDGLHLVDITGDTPAEKGDQWVAFDSRQIKSTDNSGAFNPKNPDIRFMPSLKDAKVKTSDVQFKREKPIKGAVGGVLDVVHFSSKDLSQIDPTKSFGKGAATPTDLKGEPKAFFYTKGTAYEAPIASRPNVYTAKVDGNSIYDLNTDALDVQSIVNREKRDQAIKDAGFKGFYVETPGFDAVAIYDKVKVNPALRQDVMSPKQMKNLGLDKQEAPSSDAAARSAIYKTPEFEKAARRIAKEEGSSTNGGYFDRIDQWVDSQLAKKGGAQFMPAAEVSDEGRISTRNPSGVKSKEDPLTEDLKADIATMKETPELLRTNAKLIAKYPALRLSTVSPDKIVAELKNLAEANLTYLHDQTPKVIRDRSKLWYDGGRKLAEGLSTQYQSTPEGAAGVIAALSPQKDWYQNVDLADRVFKNLGELKDSEVEKSHVDWLAGKLAGDTSANAVKRALLDGLEGSKFSELPRLQQAMVLRANDELNHDRGYRLVSPEGDYGDFVRSASGSKSKVAWGDFGSIAKAVGIANNPTRETISNSLGLQHKVRNFYNNIAFPASNKGDVTVDTHAVAAALLSPLSGSSTEVLHNFGGGGASGSSLTGISGTYPVYADAYRDVAKKLGMLPRELQSITWEAVRGLFTDTFKTPENANKTAQIWKRYAAGDISIAEAQSQISTLAGGIRHPSWYAAR